MLLELLEWLVAVVFAVFFLTQVLVPMWKGTPYCPMLRRRRRELEHELTEVKEDKEVAALQNVIDKEKEELAPRAKTTKTSKKKQTLPKGNTAEKKEE